MCFSTTALVIHFVSHDLWDFAVMFRKSQGTFEWPGLEAVLMCPCCGKFAIPDLLNGAVSTPVSPSMVVGEWMDEMNVSRCTIRTHHRPMSLHFLECLCPGRSM